MRIGLPCSSVISLASASRRSSMSWCAWARYADRSYAVRVDHVANAASAASIAALHVGDPGVGGLTDDLAGGGVPRLERGARRGVAPFSVDEQHGTDATAGAACRPRSGGRQLRWNEGLVASGGTSASGVATSVTVGPTSAAIGARRSRSKP